MSELMVAPRGMARFPVASRQRPSPPMPRPPAIRPPRCSRDYAVPAVFPVILVFAAQEAARADLPAAAWERARGGVHGEHDIVLHRPLVLDEPLDTWAQISAVRTSRAGTHVVVHLEQTDADGHIAVEQWWTMVLLGLHRRRRCGIDARRPSLPRRRAGQCARRREPTPRRATSPIATPRCPATGRRTTSTSRSRGRPDSTSCSLTACARWRSARTACSACSASTIPAGFRESQCDLLADTVGRGADGECLWHRPEFGRIRGDQQRRADHHPRKIGTAAMTKPEIGVYLPQMGFTYDDILHRTLRCEELGIDSLWLYDHLYGPGAPDYPSMEAWTLATALLSRTERIRVGHMVLCNQFRHPAVLAKMATTLDQISAGRLQLGSAAVRSRTSTTGSASRGAPSPSVRHGWARRWRSCSRRLPMNVIDFKEAFHRQDMPIKPGPVPDTPAADHRGRGRREVHAALVARYADVWNVPTYALGKLEHKSAVLRSKCEEIGRDPDTIVLSVEAVMALAPDDDSLPAVRTLAEKRFGLPALGCTRAG